MTTPDERAKWIAVGERIAHLRGRLADELNARKLLEYSQDGVPGITTGEVEARKRSAEKRIAELEERIAKLREGVEEP